MLKQEGKAVLSSATTATSEVQAKNCSASGLIPTLSRFSDINESVIYPDYQKAYDGSAIICFITASSKAVSQKSGQS